MQPRNPHLPDLMRETATDAPDLAATRHRIVAITPVERSDRANDPPGNPS